MRYGRKQLKMKARVKSDLQKMVTIDDLAEGHPSPEFYLAKMRQESIEMFDDEDPEEGRVARLPACLEIKFQAQHPVSSWACVCAMALSLHAIDAELRALASTPRLSMA